LESRGGGPAGTNPMQEKKKKKNVKKNEKKKKLTRKSKQEGDNLNEATKKKAILGGRGVAPRFYRTGKDCGAYQEG